MTSETFLVLYLLTVFSLAIVLIIMFKVELKIEHDGAYLVVYKKMCKCKIKEANWKEVYRYKL